MSLKQQILSDLKKAMKSGDSFKRDVLRFLDSAVKNDEIEKKKKEEGLNNEEIIELISRSIKQHKDSISQYEKGGRKDLADKEKKELEILSAYMPEQLSEDKIREIVKSAIKETQATTSADMGKVMGAAMKQMKGATDGNAVRKIVEEELK
jgi:uncharacterized protein YqeY